MRIGSYALHCWYMVRLAGYLNLLRAERYFE